MDEHSEGCSCFSRPLDRRAALIAAVGMILGLHVVRAAAAEEVDPRNVRPQKGDHLVFADGDRQGAIITPKDLALDGPRVLAFPMDPGTRAVRDGSRLNKVLLVRLDPEKLAEETRRRSADGTVAYSAICTHEGCDVWEWQDDTKTFWCPCHDSRFDPRNGGRVVAGPAPRRLAALPLKVADGVLTVAGGFTGPVGPRTR